jgi:hypothetical protein
VNGWRRYPCRRLGGLGVIRGVDRRWAWGRRIASTAQADETQSNMPHWTPGGECSLSTSAQAVKRGSSGVAAASGARAPPRWSCKAQGSRKRVSRRVCEAPRRLYEQVVVAAGLSAGAQGLSLSGVEAHCAASPLSPIAFPISAGTTTELKVMIVCSKHEGTSSD